MKNILFVIICLYTINVTAQEAYSNRIEHYYFYENNRIARTLDPDRTVGDLKRKDGSYAMTKISGIDYLIILWDDKTWEKYIMLNGWERVLCLYDRDGEPAFLGARFSLDGSDYKWSIPGFVEEGISATSSLREWRAEGNRVYSPDKINGRIGEAWSEGLPGNGIGEKIFFQRQSLTQYAISIGYVSYSRPNLYFENSRPKKLRATFDNKKFIEIELKDTPNLQSLEISELFYDGMTSDILTLEIIEVYAGTKYTDTCINAIMGYFSQ